MELETLNEEEKIQIVQTLLRLTRDKRISWMKRKGAQSGFRLTLGSHVYVLFSRDDDNVAPFTLEIYTEGNEDVFGPDFTINTLPSDSPFYSPTVNEDLAELYRLAYVEVNRPAETIRNLLEELEGVERGDLPPF